MNIPSIISCFEPDKNNEPVSVSGWVRTVRSSSSQLLFCVLNDGSDVNGLQVVISNDYLSVSKIHTFEKEVKILVEQGYSVTKTHIHTTGTSFEYIAILEK